MSATKVHVTATLELSVRDDNYKCVEVISGGTVLAKWRPCHGLRATTSSLWSLCDMEQRDEVANQCAVLFVDQVLRPGDES